MKNAPMRFGSFALHHNPSKLVIKESANIVKLNPPCSQPDSRFMGRGLRIVSGEGELFGSDCLKQYEQLSRLCEKGDRALLTLPHMKPMSAYLAAICMTAEPVDDVIGYTFTFVEAEGVSSQNSSAGEYITESDGESLWDIAFENGVDIDSLVRLNPQISYIGNISRGERVRLC